MGVFAPNHPRGACDVVWQWCRMCVSSPCSVEGRAGAQSGVARGGCCARSLARSPCSTPSLEGKETWQSGSHETGGVGSGAGWAATSTSQCQAVKVQGGYNKHWFWQSRALFSWVGGDVADERVLVGSRGLHTLPCCSASHSLGAVVTCLLHSISTAEVKFPVPCLPPLLCIHLQIQDFPQASLL